MAPQCPEEVDVFTVPHSRMKELVCKYLDMLTATNFSNVGHVTYLLESLIKTFQEFIAHEQIENQFIMKRLKNKLRSLSIQNTAVCNCHKDNRLTDMLKFLQDGYKRTKKSDVDHINYGIQLRQALEDFTETFLPHMAEEEEVFQPLLMQHFTVDELKQLKATVIQQHFKMESNEAPEKFVADNETSESHVATESESCEDSSNEKYSTHVGSLPDEILTKVFSYLNPQELCRSAQVCRRWNHLAYDGSLWTELYPVSWAKGLWNAGCGVNEEDTIDVNKKLNSKAYDEDADIDETDDWNEESLEIQYQSKMLTSMCKHLLPHVGRHIKHCDLAYSKGLTNGTLYKILSLCPNMEYLDITQTRVSDLGFKGFKKSCGKKLKHLDLSGCLYVTNLTLQRLATALGQAPCHMTETMDEEKDCGREKDKKDDGFHGTDIDKTDDKCMKCEANRQGKVFGSWDITEIASYCQRMLGNPDCCLMMKNGKCGLLNAVKNRCCETKNWKSKNGLSSSAIDSCASHEKDLQADCFTSECCDKMERGKRTYQRTDGVTGRDETTREWNGCNGCHGNYEEDGKVSLNVFNGQNKNPLENPDKKNADCHCDNQDRSWKKQEKHTEMETRLNALHINPIRSDRVVNGVDNMYVPHDSADKRHCSDHAIPCKNQQPSGRNEPPSAVNTVMSNDCMAMRTEILKSLNELDVPNQMLAGLELSDLQPEIPHPSDGGSIAVDDGGSITVDKDNAALTERPLEFLSLSGCHQITDVGLDYLTSTGGLPKLRHLDLSGCLNVDGEAVSALVATAPSLDPVNLFYCDNITDGPYADTASGCQNLQCASRVCCRCGE